MGGKVSIRSNFHYCYHHVEIPYIGISTGPIETAYLHITDLSLLSPLSQNKQNRYGQHGYEMINVTYVGDQLIAYKVTGDKSVPRGEITFQADLNPLRMKNVIGNDPSSSTSTSTEENLEPINLTPYAAEKWGTSQLPRHKGLGQVAETGFNNNQWMDGQLIIIGEEYFSFAWVPIEQQIFFGRPSPELALKMLREIGAAAITPFKSWEEPPTLDSDVNVLKDYVSSCLEKTTESVEEEMGGDAFGCIWTGGETDESYFQ